MSSVIPREALQHLELRLQGAIVGPLEEAGFFEEIEGRELSALSQEFGDRKLLNYLLEALHDWGYIYLAGTKVYRTAKRPEVPPVVGDDVEDFMVVPSKVFSRLYEAVKDGKRPFHVSSPENRALFYRFMDSRFLKMMLLEGLRRLGLSSIPRGAVVADLSFHMGVVTGIIAMETEAAVVAVDPSQDMLDLARERLNAQGLLRDNISFIRSAPERVRQAVSSAGHSVIHLAVVAEKLNWIRDPILLLKNAASVLAPGGRGRERGYIGILQSVWDDPIMRGYSLATYLMGSDISPRRSDVDKWLRASGLRYKVEGRGPMFMARAWR